MRHKITWNMIRNDFKNRHPTFHKKAIYWRPHDYSTILIYLKDGKKITYDYDTKEIKFLIERWKKD